MTEIKEVCQLCTAKVTCDSCKEIVWDVFEMDKHRWKDLK